VLGPSLTSLSEATLDPDGTVARASPACRSFQSSPPIFQPTVYQRTWTPKNEERVFILSSSLRWHFRMSRRNCSTLQITFHAAGPGRETKHLLENDDEVRIILLDLELADENGTRILDYGPPPGTTPAPTSKCNKIAFSRLAKRMSQARANSLPTPVARPRIDAIDTTGPLINSRASSLYLRARERGCAHCSICDFATRKKRLQPASGYSART